MTNKFFNKPVFLDYFMETFHMFDDLGEHQKIIDWPSYPVNVYLDSDHGINFEIAASNVERELINVNYVGSVLTIEIKCSDGNNIECEYLCRKLVKKPIKLEYKLGDDMDLDNTKVSLDRGILNIIVPIKEDVKPKKKTFTIK